MHQTPGSSPQSQIFLKTMGAFFNLLAGAWATALRGVGCPEGNPREPLIIPCKFFMRTSAHTPLLQLPCPLCSQAS